MTHYRKFFDDKFLAAHDLREGSDIVLVMTDVRTEEVRGERGDKAKKPSVGFEKAKKRLLLNSTNARTIANLYGNHVEGWKGKRIAIYATTTEAFGETKDCIRVRPRIPDGRPNRPTQGQPLTTVEAEREPGDDAEETDEGGEQHVDA